MDDTTSAASVMAARLFPAERRGSIPTAALRFFSITRQRFASLNAAWHSSLPRIGAVNTIKICYGAGHDGELYAVAAWSNPVSRLLCQHSILELRRLAVAPDAPRNTASRMLGWMLRDLRVRYPGLAKLISYMDAEAHSGTIYRAAGWSPVALRRNTGDWANRTRSNRSAARITRKIRWEKRVTR